MNFGEKAREGYAAAAHVIFYIFSLAAPLYSTRLPNEIQ
jgi:hypothetical protein